MPLTWGIPVGVGRYYYIITIILPKGWLQNQRRLFRLFPPFRLSSSNNPWLVFLFCPYFPNPTQTLAWAFFVRGKVSLVQSNVKYLVPLVVALTRPMWPDCKSRCKIRQKLAVVHLIFSSNWPCNRILPSQNNLEFESQSWVKVVK